MVNYQYDGNKPISVLIQGCEKIMQTSEFYLKKPALNRYLDEQTDNILTHAKVESVAVIDGDTQKMTNYQQILMENKKKIKTNYF